MPKKHHMTKYQYNTYAKNHRAQTFDDDEFGTAALSEKMRKRDEERLLNQIRHFHGHAADLLADEGDTIAEGDPVAEGTEYDEEADRLTG